MAKSRPVLFITQLPHKLDPTLFKISNIKLLWYMKIYMVSLCVLQLSCKQKYLKINDHLQKTYRDVKKKIKYIYYIFLYESICNVKLYLVVICFLKVTVFIFMLMYMISKRRHTESKVKCGQKICSLD